MPIVACCGPWVAGRGPAAGGVVAEPGVDDPEHPVSSKGRRLQRRLARLVDAQRLGDLSASLEAAAQWHDVRCIADLRHDTTLHEWLWALDPRAPGALEPDACVAAVQVRLWAGFGDAPTACRACGRPQEAVVDTRWARP